MLPIDAQSLLSRCMDDVEFASIMLEKFKVQAAAMVDQVAESVMAGDALAISQRSHALKGAAANLSAEKMRAIAKRLEEMGRMASLDGAMTALEELKHEMDLCAAFIPGVLSQWRSESGVSAAG